MSMRYPGGLIASTPVTANYPSGVWTQAQAIPYQSQNVWSRDQFWPYTTLLLQGDGAVNGAQNNTFLDSSSNNFTITRNGNTTQGSFTPYEQDGYWSNFLNSGYLSLTNSTGLGSNNFTIEFWGLDISGSSNWGLFSIGGTSGSDFAGVTMASNGGLYISTSGTSWQYSNIGGLTFSTDGQWHHYAIVRNGGSLLTFKDGVLIATTSITGTIVNNSGQWRVGAKSDQTGATTGYLSNFRVVNGTALYTSAFTPSAAPLTAITNTSLLTCQSNRFKDNSTNNFTISTSGSPSVQAFQPFPGATTWSASVLGGSGYFDGTGDYLTAPSNAAFAFGTGAYTVEAWVYMTGTDTFTSVVFSAASANDSFNLGIDPDGSFGVSRYGAGGVVTSAAGAIPTNCWCHIAAVRTSTSSNDTRLYVNGVLNTTGTDSNNWTVNSAPIIGGFTTFSTFDFIGYMCDLRVVKGSAIAPPAGGPTSPLTAVTNTSLLLSFTNAGIYDNSMMNNLETVGNAQVSTSVVKYGTGSMAFDGSGDYLFAANNPGQRIMGGDFTVEMWMYLGAAQANMGLVSSYENNNGWIVRLDTTYIRFFYGISGSGTANDVTYSFSPGVWYHIAWVKSGTSLRCYINGTQQGSTFTVSGAVDTTTAGMQVGRTQTNTNDFNGYIDDLRVTKGAARYITTFTPPPARLPAQ